MCVHVCKLSHVPLFMTPGTVGHQTPLSTEFSGQEHWSGCHFILQGIFVTQGSNLLFLHPLHWQADSLPLQNLRSPGNVIFPANSGKKKKYLLSSQPSDCSHSPRWALRQLRMWKYHMLAPGSWGAHQRTDFSEPRLLYLPIHRKALYSLTWDIWFSLINDNLFMFLDHLPFVIKLLYSLASPCLLGAVSQSYLKCCLLGCDPHFAPSKT